MVADRLGQSAQVVISRMKKSEWLRVQGEKDVRLSRWAIVLIAAMASLVLLGLSSLLAVLTRDDHPQVWAQVAASDYPNCRFGVGAIANPITTYPITPMRFGWYVNWSAPLSPIKPAGVDFHHTIRVKQDKSGSTYLPTYQITPTLGYGAGELGPIVAANPGSVWIIGNEPDRVYYQDESLPDMYATIYHDAYTFIKGIDPTARVAIGAVIQPTPVRLQYLDMILDAYRSQYGISMPIDVWNVHLYILQETVYSWGASIPPGVNVTTGMLYTIPQHVDINVFTSLIADMRTWMKERGYRNTPLIITEYGVLFAADVLAGYGFTQTDLDNFVRDVVNHMNTATDANIGYPADNYRLVQQAAMYSLDDDSSDGSGGFRWGSFLFRSTWPYTITAAGLNYQSIAQGLAASVGLLPYMAVADPQVPIVPPGGSITTTFKALVSNAGNSTMPVSTTVRFFDVTGGGDVQVGSDVTLAPFGGCGTVREASVVWPDLSQGWHSVRIEVDPADQIAETLESNNVITTHLFIGTNAVYLPNVQR